MRTLIIALAALLLPTTALLTSAAPGEAADRHHAILASLDPAQVVHQTVSLPEGHVLKGAFVDGVLVVSTEPLVQAPGPLPLNHGPGGVANCLADVPFSAFWVPAGFNRASLGQCVYQLHNVGIGSFTFTHSPIGDGRSWADALDYNTFSYLYMECVTTVGLGTTCNVSHSGTAFNTWTNWDSLVGNDQIGNTEITWS